MKESNNLAVMSYSFHGLHNVGTMNIFGYLESVKYRYNLVTADIWNGFFDSYEDAYVDKVAQHINERGLEVVNFSCDKAHVWDNDPVKRADNEKSALRFIEIAKKIGAKSIRIDMGVREDVISYEQFVYIANKYEQYCALAAEFGAKLGPENHWGASKKFPEFKRFVDHMIDDRKVKNFGILLHVGGWHDAKTHEEELERDLAVINYAMHMHLDYDHSMRANEIIPKLKEKGYYGCWTVEHHTGVNEYNNVAIQLATLKSVLLPLIYDGKWKDAPPSVKE